MPENANITTKKHKGRQFGTFKFRSRKQLQKLIDEYFEIRAEANNPPTLSSLALHLNIHRDTLYQYNKREQFGDIIDKARLRCIEAVETKMLRNQLNPTACIFYLKNNSSYRDKVEQDITSKGEKIGGLMGILNELDGRSKKLEEVEKK